MTLHELNVGLFMSQTKKTKACVAAVTLYNSIEVVATSNISQNTFNLKSSLLFLVPPDTFLVSASILILGGRDCSVGIATRYRLDGPGIVSR